MKLKATCGNCQHVHVFSEPVVNLNNEACPKCNQPYRYSGYTTMGLHDEESISPDVIRNIICEELDKRRMSIR